MKTDLYFVEGPWPGRLAVAPRPRGGDWLVDEMRAWQQAGIGVVLSLLTPPECSEFELDEEADACRSVGLQLLSFPIEDRTVPASRDETARVVTEIVGYLRRGIGCAIHCRQGIGRAALIAACLLVWSGVDAETAINRVTLARGRPVPETAEQRAWLAAFAGFTAVSRHGQ
jgi:protein-tyrosine phosphatase